LFFFQFQYGQITELRRILPDSSTYATFNVVEKARFHIEAGEISKAEQFFFNALESGLMQSEDFLLFANCLMASNKKSLAREMFREYQNLSDNTLGPIADLVNSVLNVDTSQSYGRNLVAGSKGIYGLSSYDGKIYGNKDGYIFGYHAACPGEVGEGLYCNLGRHSSSIAAVSFYNSGYSAVYSYWDEKKRQYILCIVEREGSQWSKPIKLSFCNDGFN
jgi:hypothetical protein